MVRLEVPSPSPLFSLLGQAQRQRVSDGASVSIVEPGRADGLTLVLLWPQLGDFDSLEYAWWLQRYGEDLATKNIQVRAVGIGDRTAGQRFCDYTGFPAESLLVDPAAEIHQQLELYGGLGLKIPGLPATGNAWINLLLMCAGIGSPGTLREVLRGYTGDRQAPQLIDNQEVVRAAPLPPLSGKMFRWAGGQGFQRPFELATLRLRNMTEVLSHWRTYVPNGAYLTQRGGTFVFDAAGTLIYEHRDRGILGFSETMGHPLSFLDRV